MLEETELACPYCNATQTLLIDVSTGDTSYVEDCQVCCQPMVIRVSVAPDGTLQAVDAAPENP